MSPKKVVLASLASLMGLVACAPIEFDFTSGPEVAAALSGKSVVGNLVGVGAYCEFHDANGLVVGRDTELYAGTWEMNNNAICYAYPGFATDCQLALISGNRARFMDGFGTTVASGNIVDGNVCA